MQGLVARGGGWSLRFWGEILYSDRARRASFFGFLAFFVLLIAIVSRSSDLLYFVIRHVIHYLSGSALIIRRVIFVGAD